MRQLITVIAFWVSVCHVATAQEAVTDTTVYEVNSVEKWPEYHPQ